ncbi:hypothetical protein Vretimale_9511 [Volvox reticuliferus]|uniref:Uncharacterized protein n=1 Tax=Volvox reticuliferus TaxID=1737510 RepID=A0A8J4G000_9CHLO|nr:hypothetical protein Vretifemale_18769 [Volvox reticuliferus]GIM05051.1 hypothetical protein Vretimale_9511 [Volvox reticuliferus]
MGAGCCKADLEFNPDNTLKDPQTKEQKKEDGKDLRRAALAADWAQMRMLLRRMPLRQICSTADKNEAAAEDELGNTALHYSVSINHLRGVKKLLRYGTPPGLPNKAGKTPLHLALESGKLQAARILMEKAAASKAVDGKPSSQPNLANVQDAKGVTSLLAVVAAGRLRLAREVLTLCKELDMRVNFDVIDSEGNSLALYAAKWGWFDELENWISNCQEPKKVLNVQNKEGETILGHVLMFQASGLLDKQRALELTTKLMELGALAKLPSFKEKVPLINIAAAADNKPLYDLLVSKGADPLASRDVLGRSPLHFAAAKGSHQLAVELLEKGIKAYALDGQGNTPLHLAAMRGQEALVTLLLERADDKIKALLTPNKSGLTAYHLALKAGPTDKAQRNSLGLIEALGEKFTTPVLGPKKTVSDTPLLLAIQGHQNKVVRALLQKGCSPNERNVEGELPLARVLRCATAATYDKDSDIFDQLMAAGSDMAAASETAHPLLALCKNNLSNFTEKVVGVLKERSGGSLDWNKRDAKGYTPLALAAFHDNAWLVRYLVDVVGIDPNAENQRSSPTEPEVVGTTGGLCSAKPITVRGTVAGQTPLMCAAKGASVAAVQLLLNRKADVHAVDAEGRTALQHAMHLDKASSLQVAAALLQMGARPERGVKVTGSPSGAGKEGKEWQQCTDLVGEHWPHRAVRYGVSSFLKLWVECGGALDSLLSTTADDADDMPGAELRVEEKTDFLDLVPSRVNNHVEAEDEELKDDYNGEDSEQAAPGEDKEGTDASRGGQPVAEGLEAGRARQLDRTSISSDGSSGECGEDDEDWDDGMAELFASGQADSFYEGPTPMMILKWRRRGMQWWDEFWVDRDSLPDTELEDDPHWEDTYNICEEGDEWIDEEDVEDEIWERIRAEQRNAANALRRAEREAAASAAARQQQGQQPLVEDQLQEVTEAMLLGRASRGLAHRLFRHRLPNATVPKPRSRLDEGAQLASGNPSKWLRNRSTSGSGILGFTKGATRSSPFLSGDNDNLDSPTIMETAAPSSALRTSPSFVHGNGGIGQHLPGPVAEAREIDDERTVLLLSPGGHAVLRPEAAETTISTEAEGPLPTPQRIVSIKNTQGSAKSATTAFGAAVGGLVRGESNAISGTVSQNAAVMAKSVSSLKGMLTSGVSGNQLYANETYYQPDTLYVGLPRYMAVPTEPHQVDKYKKYVTDLETRVKSYAIKDDKILEGPELRARNMSWYHKSMSPTEYPLKPGKWKSFQRMSLKAIEQARLRRPCKPGEKPRIRQKKVWFGLPPMPSRPELALTSPLVYAVRLGRVKCVEVLLQCSGGGLLDLPDAHGVTPLSYALFLLTKDRHNKSLEQIVNMLLVAHPRVDTMEIWRTHLRPRLNKQLAALEEQARKDDGKSMTKEERQTLQDLRESSAFLDSQKEQPPNMAKLFPSLLEPLILTVLLNDVTRMTYLVQELGANPDNTWVWLPDIPIYCNGLWEKQLARCHSRCLPLHVAICQKTYESVRALLDLGADPNHNGEEYTGQNLRDQARKSTLARQKQEELKKRQQEGNKPNLYVKLWAEQTRGLKAILVGTKHLISRIEIPGLTKPHPWLSPLHLACRFGLADIAFLLIKRGAAVNGGPASAYAPRSPLEEALMYARSNAQAYSTTSRRSNYNYILEETCLAHSERMAAQICEAKEKQKQEHDKIKQRVEDHIGQLAAKSKDKEASAKGLQDKVKAFTSCTLAMYDPISLEHMPIPPENEAVLNSRLQKAFDDLQAMMDPIKGAIKAVVLAAKIIIRILLDMLKRPIAHYDPALACAHVLLYYRAPINVAEKQTGILVRDILDNGNGVGNMDVRKSYYKWLGIDPESMQEHVWIKSVVNKITVLKSNVAYGYQVMDMAMDYKQYDNAKRKFMSQVEASILNVGVNNFMPHYLMKVLEEIIAPVASQQPSGGGVTGSMEAMLDALLEDYIQSTAATAAFAKATDAIAEPVAEGRENQARGSQRAALAPNAPVVTQADLDEVARGLLPTWIYNAPPPPSGQTASMATPAVIVLTPTSDKEQVKTLIINKFLRYMKEGAIPEEYLPPPVDTKPAEHLIEGEDLKIETPTIPPEAFADVQPTQGDLPESDVCTAVVRAYNARLVKFVKAHSDSLQKLQALRKDSASLKRELMMKDLSSAITGALRKAQMEHGLYFDEGPIFEAAIENPTWEAAISQLGDGAAVRALMTRLRAAQASGELPRISDALALAKGLGSNPVEKGVGALLDALESGLGTPLPAKLRSDLSKSMSTAVSSVEAAMSSAVDDPKALFSSISRKATDFIETAAQSPEATSFAETLLENKIDPRVAPMLRAVARMAETRSIPDPEAFLNDLTDEAWKRGAGAVQGIWERKFGKALPDEVRLEVEKCAEDFADQVARSCEENGLEGALGAFKNVTAAMLASTEGRIVDIVENNVEASKRAVSGLMDGDISALTDGGLELPIAVAKKLATSGRVGQVMVAAADNLAAAPTLTDDNGMDVAVEKGKELLNAVHLIRTEGIAVLDDVQRAVEAALQSGDFTALAALGSRGRSSRSTAALSMTAFMEILQEFKSQLVAISGDGDEAAISNLDQLVGKVQQTAAMISEGPIQKLVAGVAAVADQEGFDALAEVFEVDPAQLVDELASSPQIPECFKGVVTQQQGVSMALQALQGNGGVVDADSLLVGRLAPLKHPLARELLGKFMESKLLFPDSREDLATLHSELLQAVKDFMTGLDLDLSLDVSSLIAELDDFREILIRILENLNIDEAF